MSARRSPSRGAARAAATLCRRLAPSTLLCRISYAVRFPVDLQLPGDVLEAAAEPQERGGRLELSGAAAATPNGRPIGTQGAQSKRAIMAGCNIDKARRKVWRHPAWGAPAAGSTRAGGIAEGSSQVVTPSPARRCSLKVNAVLRDPGALWPHNGALGTCRMEGITRSLEQQSERGAQDGRRRCLLPLPPAATRPLPRPPSAGIRSFSPDNQNVIEFYRPLTLIVGHNGAGKTVRGCGRARRAPRSAGRCITAGGPRQRPPAPVVWPPPSPCAPSLPPPDRDRVPENGVHGGAAAQHPLRPELHPRPKGRSAGPFANS